MSTLDRITRKWDPPLSKKVGGQTLLAGLDVYYDFDWKEVFGHGRATFRNGQRLARVVKKDCPDGKIPCLLLTKKDDVTEEPISTDTHYVVVIRIHKYLAASSADHAVTYLAKDFEGAGGITALRSYEEVILSAQALDDILDLNLDKGAILRWLDRNSNGLAILRDAVDTMTGNDDAPSPVSQHDLATAITTVERLTPELCHAMVTALGAGGPVTVRRLAKELSSTRDGRRAASEAQADQVTSRIADVRSASNGYRELLSDPEATETDLQDFIGKYPWLLGMEYVRVLPKQEVIRGEVDFLVERHDGYHDLLELKGPNHAIIRSRSVSATGPRPPSEYSLGGELSQALAQVHHYRAQLTSHEAAMEELYGIRHTRYPRVIIVIGRAGDLPETEKRILRQLNQSLHRMEVMPYDVLADRADAQLKPYGKPPCYR